MSTPHRRLSNIVRVMTWILSVVLLAKPSVAEGPSPSTSGHGHHTDLPLEQPKLYVTSSLVPSDFAPSSDVEFYGNYHTAGVIATMPEGVTAQQVATMRCSLNVDGRWEPVHDLVQVGQFPWFATSLFWLSPASRYQVKVEAIGTNQMLLATWYGEGQTRADPQLPNTAITYYVAIDGDDTNPGSRERPFRTISHSLTVVKAGETVAIRGGTYREGQLQFKHNGQEGSPIVVRCADGERVVIDGTDAALENAQSWSHLGNQIYTHPYSAKTANACVEELATGRVIRLFPVPTMKELQARTLIDTSECQQGGPFDQKGIEGAIYTDETTAYLALPQPIERYRVRLPQQNRAIELSRKQHIQIDGLQFDHFGTGEQSTALFLSNSSDVLIQNCRLNYNDCFIYVKGQCDRLTIQNNHFRDAILDWPFGYMKCSSGVSGFFEGGAVNVDARYSGRGLVFRRNVIEGVFDGVHLTPWREDNARTQETDFYENHLSGCLDDFVECDGFSRNTRIINNVMDRSLTGISVAQALDGPTFVLNNVIANCGVVRAAQREENYGYPFKTNGGEGAEIGSGPLFFYHNTAHTSDPNSRALLVKRPTWKKLVMRNNIWCGQKAGFDLWHEQPSPIDWDYDNLFVSDPTAPLVVQSYRKRIPKLVDVRKRFQWLPHGLSVDPRFVDPRKSDYRLQEDSPCIDAGVVLPGINSLSSRGRAPDLGAYEKR
ncbi:MAG: right-handed parallel beta-helix repeat-containing protein [Planctomycetaceae bacterium]